MSCECIFYYILLLLALDFRNLCRFTRYNKHLFLLVFCSVKFYDLQRNSTVENGHELIELRMFCAIEFNWIN